MANRLHGLFKTPAAVVNRIQNRQNLRPKVAVVEAAEFGQLSVVDNRLIQFELTALFRCLLEQVAFGADGRDQ